MTSLKEVREELADLVTRFKGQLKGKVDLQTFKGLVYAYGVLSQVFEKEREGETWETRIKALEDIVYERDKSKTA